MREIPSESSINALRVWRREGSHHPLGEQIKCGLDIRMSEFLSFLKIILFIYDLAALGLRCGTWDLVPCQGLNPGPLHWELGVLATGPPGKSHRCLNFGEQHYSRVGHGYCYSWYLNCLPYLACLSGTKLPPSDLGKADRHSRGPGEREGSGCTQLACGTKRLTELSR